MAAREQPCMQMMGEALSVNMAAPARTVAVPAECEYRIEVVADAAGLLELKQEWDQLLAQAGMDHPFLNHAWIADWWHCFGAGRTLNILLVREGARLAGIAPLMRSEKKMYGINVRCLEAIYNPHTPRFDFIATPGEASGVYRSIWRHLRAHGGWDLLELSQLPADSRALAELSQLARGDGCATGIWHGEQSPYIPFSGTFESFFSQLSYNHRSKVKRKLNRLRERGEVRLEQISSAEQVDSALDDGFRIEAAGWKSQIGTSINAAPEVAAFYRAFARHAAAMGMLRLLFLTLDGVRIAFGYGIYHRNKLYVLKTGYDQAYSYYSPYNLMCYLVYEDGFANDLAEYEFLGNNDAWKLAWTRLVRRHDWLYIFAPRLRARLLYLIKFRWIPLLQRQSFYRRLRDALFPKGKARLAAQDGEQMSPDGN